MRGKKKGITSSKTLFTSPYCIGPFFTLSQMTNLRLFRTEQICMTKAYGKKKNRNEMQANLDMQSNLTKRMIHSFLYHTITSFNKPVKKENIH